MQIVNEVDWLLQSLYAFIFLRKVSKLQPALSITSQATDAKKGHFNNRIEFRKKPIDCGEWGLLSLKVL
jgi:hypothetical protein